MTLSVNQFEENLKHYVDGVVDKHEALTVNRTNGEDFVVISLEDYNREQETLYVLNNNNLMGQIERSLESYQKRAGYTPTEDALNLEGDA